MFDLTWLTLFALSAQWLLCSSGETPTTGTLEYEGIMNNGAPVAIIGKFFGNSFTSTPITGTVEFLVDGVSFGSLHIIANNTNPNEGSVVFENQYFRGGYKNFSLIYSGDETYANATTSQIMFVGPAYTQTKIVSVNPTPALFQNFNFTIEVRVSVHALGEPAMWWYQFSPSSQSPVFPTPSSPGHPYNPHTPTPTSTPTGNSTDTPTSTPAFIIPTLAPNASDPLWRVYVISVPSSFNQAGNYTFAFQFNNNADYAVSNDWVTYTIPPAPLVVTVNTPGPFLVGSVINMTFTFTSNQTVPSSPLTDGGGLFVKWEKIDDVYYSDHFNLSSSGLGYEIDAAGNTRAVGWAVVYFREARYYWFQVQKFAGNYQDLVVTFPVDVRTVQTTVRLTLDNFSNSEFAIAAYISESINGPGIRYGVQHQNVSFLYNGSVQEEDLFVYPKCPVELTTTCHDGVAYSKARRFPQAELVTVVYSGAPGVNFSDASLLVNASCWNSCCADPCPQTDERNDDERTLILEVVLPVGVFCVVLLVTCLCCRHYKKKKVVSAPQLFKNDEENPTQIDAANFKTTTA